MGKIFDWSNQRRVEDLAMSRDGRWLVAMDDTSHIQAFKLHTRELEYEMDLQVRLASVNISQDCRHLLVNHNNGIAQLIDLVRRETVQRYTGHTGGDYMIRNGFGGANESFILGGSEGTFDHQQSHLVSFANPNLQMARSISGTKLAKSP